MYQRALGRLRRSINLTAPHLLLMADAKFSTLPAEIDRSDLIVQPWGMMLNGPDDEDANAPILNDCTVAALYHGKQLVDAMTKLPPIPNQNACVLRAFKDLGYDPNNPATNTGLYMQDVLNYNQTRGLPAGPVAREQSVAWFELDHTNEDHIKHVIDTCGYCCIGAEMPTSVMQQEYPFFNATKGADIEGGHEFILWGYKANGLYKVVSWGSGDIYMTSEFLRDFADEAYAVVDDDLVKTTGKTPGGLSVAQLQSYLASYKIG